jgi:hypothetical protein
MTTAISNGETGSSVRTKLNEIIAVANQFEFTNSERNINVRPSINYIDPTVKICVVAGGGDSGSSTRPYEAAGATNRNEIGANASYVAGTANYATISGGYDHRNDQLAGTIGGGGHNLLNYQGNHGTIGGGSLNSVLAASHYSVIAGGTSHIIGETAAAAYSTIGGGQLNKIKAATNNTISGGSTNTIEGGTLYSVIGGGFSNSINSSAEANIICSGRANSITGAATWTGIVGGRDNTTAAVGSFIGAGRENTINASASYAVAFGERHSVGATGLYSLSFGQRVSAVVRGSLNFAGGDFGSVVGSQQGTSFTVGRQTTDATLTELTSAGSSVVPLPPSNSAWAGRITVIGRQQGSTNVAMWSWDFGISRATGNIVIKYGGTAPTALVDDITVGAVPEIQSGTSAFRIRVTGKAATSIDWVARVDLIQTLQ